jgi:hypothetical protein
MFIKATNMTRGINNNLGTPVAPTLDISTKVAKTDQVHASEPYQTDDLPPVAALRNLLTSVKVGIFHKMRESFETMQSALGIRS